MEFLQVKKFFYNFYQQFNKIKLHKFKSVWNVILTNEIDEELMKRLKFFLSFNDVRYFTLKFLDVKFYANKQVILLKNLFFKQMHFKLVI